MSTLSLLSTVRFPALLHLAGAVTLLAAMLPAAPARAAAPSIGLVDSRQVVLVTSDGWDSNQATLRRFERAGDTQAWQEVGAAFAASLGRNGSAWGTGLHAPADQAAGPVKREGDGRSPAGIFGIGQAFGYAADAGPLRLRYEQMDATDYCIDVPASPLYNRIVDSRDVGAAAVEGSTEPMRLDLHKDGDPRYRLGLVIEHNTRAEPDQGSCIFAHLWRTPGEPTAGCTAMADADMEALLAWLDPAAQPRFVLLPVAEYRRLAAPWQLPLVEASR